MEDAPRSSSAALYRSSPKRTHTWGASSDLLPKTDIDVAVESIKAFLGIPVLSPPRYTESHLEDDAKIITILRNLKESLPPANQEVPAPAVPRFMLKLGRGSLVGRLKYREHGCDVNCSVGEGAFVRFTPRNLDFVEKIETDALFILLVRSDEAFSELAEEGFCNRFPCIIVTAHTPPDFLHKLKMEFNLPVLALFDCHPDCFKMLAFYGRLFEDIKWLGLRPTDLLKYDMVERQLTWPMTKTDIKVVKALLKNPVVKRNPKWLEELELILKCKKKAELHFVCDHGFGSEYMTRVFLPKKLQEQDWI